MSAFKLLQVGPLSDSFNQRLAASHEVIPLWTHPDRQGWLTGHGADIDMVVTSAGHGCNTALINALPNLQAICSFGVGYDSIDIEAARRRGISVSNTPNVLNDCVADLAMGLLIDAARRIAAGDRFVRDGAWDRREPFPLATRVSGKRLGIVGLGRIGKTVARRASGFDMEIRYHNRKPDPSAPYEYVASLTELAIWADFLVLTCIGGAGTWHLVDAAVLAALGRRGILVNVSRGQVVDETALVRALVDGTLGGAALDVFEFEPHVPAALRALDNVVLQPHVGSATTETRQRMHELVLDNIEAFISSGRLLTPVVQAGRSTLP